MCAKYLRAKPVAVVVAGVTECDGGGNGNGNGASGTSSCRRRLIKYI